MQKAFCFLALSACFFACQRQQASDEVLAQIQTEVPVPAEGPQTIENTPPPTTLAATPSPGRGLKSPPSQRPRPAPGSATPVPKSERTRPCRRLLRLEFPIPSENASPARTEGSR